MTTHVQINLVHQPEGETWDVEKTACGKVVPGNTLQMTRDERHADCEDCKRALINSL